MDAQPGFLTVYSADQSEIYGEFPDAELRMDGGSPSYSGVASQGALDTFIRINQEGIEHVYFRFEGSSGTKEGSGRILRPDSASETITVEPL